MQFTMRSNQARAHTGRFPRTWANLPEWLLEVPLESRKSTSLNGS
jgi:hypothetical protein